MFICGIDPGLQGAIVFLVDGKITKILDMPTKKIIKNKKNKTVLDAVKLFLIFTEIPKNGKVYLEKAHAMPGQGVTSMFTTGEMFGHLKQASIDIGIIPTLVSPQDWKKYFNLILKKQKIDKSKMTAKEITNNENLFKKEKKKKTFLKAVEIFNNKEDLSRSYKRNGEVLLKILDGRSDAVMIAYYGFKMEKK